MARTVTVPRAVQHSISRLVDTLEDAWDALLVNAAVGDGALVPQHVRAFCRAAAALSNAAGRLQARVDGRG